MMWMVVLSCVIFTAYVSAMAVKYGAKEVVSEYAYEGGMTLFTTCIGACAVAWGMATYWEIVALSLVAYVAVMQITESRWAWIAAELTGMAMVYAVCVYKLVV